MRKKSWHETRTSDHDRRKLLNAALPANSDCREFVAPDDDPDLGQTFPFGKYTGRTIAHVLEIDPGYLKWMADECDLREGAFCSAFYAVCERYEDRIESASKFRRAERF